MAGRGRVAVIGGGVSGSVCAALLRAFGNLNVTVFDKGQRLGGRASTESVGNDEQKLLFDSGAQFVRVTDPRFSRFVQSPLMRDVLQESDARYVMLGCVQGECVSREIVQQTGMFHHMTPSTTAQEKGDDDLAANQSQHRDQSAVNFYGLFEGDSGSNSLFTGTGGMGAISEQLLARTDVNTVSRATVNRLDFSPSPGGDERGGAWEVHYDIEGDDDGPACAKFDAVVLANADAHMAADTIQYLRTSTADPEMSHPTVSATIEAFEARLRQLKSVGRYTLMVHFPRPLEEVKFDAAAVHGSDMIQFISRGSSKPKGATATATTGPGDDGECWVIHSTADFARFVGTTSDEGDDRETLAKTKLRDAFLQTISHSFGASRPIPEPTHIGLKHWDNAFYDSALDLNADGGNHNDAVTFRPWSLALCGDYFSAQQSIEEAALSGMMAADHVIGWMDRA